MEPILLAGKPKEPQKKLTPEQIQQRQREEKEKQQRINERKAAERKDNPEICGNLLNDIDAILNGKLKSVNDIEKYKVIGEKDKYLVGDDPATARGQVKTSIADRIADLKADVNGLYKKEEAQKARNIKPDLKDSYKGHQNTLENQQQALRQALSKLDSQCPGYQSTLTKEQKELVEKAKQKANEEIPQKPDRYLNQNSSIIAGIVDKVPGLSRDQKDAVGKTLNGIQKVVDKGQDYWNKQGKQQVIDTLTTVAKIPFLLAVLIVAAIAAAFGFDSPLKVEAGSSDKTASAPENSTTASSNSTNSTGSPATPPEQTSNTANTGKQGTAFIIQNPTANTGKQDTAFIIPTGRNTALTGGSTALTGGSTALTGGETPQQSNNNNIELTA